MKQETKRGIDDYVLNQTPPGNFLFAVLSNDLMEACGRGDDDNLRDLVEIVRYCYNTVPRHCWGSQAKVKAWMESRKLQPV